jgi:branched-chain amino acid transport system substrate-binding protein
VNTTRRSLLALVLTCLFVLAPAVQAAAQTSGPPVRIGGTLALTGPLAATSLIHKIVGEIMVEQINKRGGFLGRPIEWVLLDDQSKPDVARTLYERLITVDKVDLLIGPYATAAILSAMGVAQRYNKVLIHHTFGVPKLAKYEMHFSANASGYDFEKVLPTKLLDALASTGSAPKSIAVVTSKFPSVHFISVGARDVATQRGLKVPLFLEYEFGTRDFAPMAARVKEADPDFLWMGSLGLEGNLMIEALQTIGYKPRGQFHLFPAPGPLLKTPGSAHSFAFTTFEAHPPMTTTGKDAELLSKLFDERARKAGLPYTLAETQAGGSFTAWQLLEAAVNATKSLDDKKMAAWLKTNTVDTMIGKLEFSGQNNYGRDQIKVKQIQGDRWVVVWPRESAAPNAKVVYPAP